jgi:hypothetical protein
MVCVAVDVDAAAALVAEVLGQAALDERKETTEFFLVGAAVKARTMGRRVDRAAKQRYMVLISPG